MRKLLDDSDICVFVANLPSGMNDSEMERELLLRLGVYGSINNVKVSRDPKNRPFGFVQFDGRVVDFLLTETVTLDDRVLRFERARSQLNVPRQRLQMISNQRQETTTTSAPITVDEIESELEEAEQGFKVFVGHLNTEVITQRKLLRRFQRHGHIVDIELFKRNLDGTLRRDVFAFISYLTEEGQFKAIKEENDQVWLNRRIKCCRALPKRDNSHRVPSNQNNHMFNHSRNNNNNKYERTCSHPIDNYNYPTDEMYYYYPTHYTWFCTPPPLPPPPPPFNPVYNLQQSNSTACENDEL